MPILVILSVFYFTTNNLLKGLKVYIQLIFPQFFLSNYMYLFVVCMCMSRYMPCHTHEGQGNF